MKKTLLILSLVLFVVSILSGVDETTRKKFGQTAVVKAAEVEVVKFEAMKPDIERYQKKTDTDLTSGFYQMYKNNLRNTYKVLLNKWLKESK
ncbi:MAG: hypothetical protein R6V77_04115 [Candidatus Cloacimonadaceae bacterium]